MGKIQRCSKETDLTAFFREKKMEEFEASFRDQEIHTIDELRECRLSEDDLRDVLHVEPLYARKQLARHIRELYPMDDPYRQAHSMDPILKSLISNIQEGLGQPEEEEEEDFVAIVGKPPPPVELEPVQDPDLAFDNDDFTEYWRMWSARIDSVFRLLFPIAFVVNLMLNLGLDYVGQLLGGGSDGTGDGSGGGGGGNFTA